MMRQKLRSLGASVRRCPHWVCGLAVMAAGVACAAAQQGKEGVASPKPPLPWATPTTATAPINSPRVALVGGTLLTAATDAPITDGVVLMSGGKIEAVGTRHQVSLPAGTSTVELDGRFVTPGLIDAHSHMGVYPVPHVGAHMDGNEISGPVTAHVRAEDGFWPGDPALGRALAGGVTTIGVLPGSANLVGGRGVTLKLRAAQSVDQMKMNSAPDFVKFACGENPKRVYGGKGSAPYSRMGNVAGYRAAFQSALEYKARFLKWQEDHQQWATEHKKDQGKGKKADKGTPPKPPPTPPDRDFGLETLVAVMDGTALVQMHCYRADEMLHLLDVFSEFGVTVRAFHHAVEAYKIRQQLRRRNVGVATWVDWWGFKMEAYDAVPQNLAMLTASGVRAVLHSDSNMLVQYLNQEAAKGMSIGNRSGVPVSRMNALRWITLNPAWLLGVSEQVGSLEVGKAADAVVWSSDPFSVYSRADLVFVDGQLAYSRAAGVRPSDFELGQTQGQFSAQWDAQ